MALACWAEYYLVRELGRGIKGGFIYNCHLSPDNSCWYRARLGYCTGACACICKSASEQTKRHIAARVLMKALLAAALMPLKPSAPAVAVLSIEKPQQRAYCNLGV